MAQRPIPKKLLTQTPTQQVLLLLSEAAVLLAKAQMLTAKGHDYRAEDLHKFRRRLNIKIRRFEAHPVGAAAYRYEQTG